MSEMTGGSEPVHVDARLLLVVSRPVFDPQGHIDAAFLVEHVFEHARRGNDLVVDRPAVSGLSLVFHGRRDRHRAADLGRVDACLAVEVIRGLLSGSVISPSLLQAAAASATESSAGIAVRPA